jgi:alkylation response protein AidB-like acyl-CoA dehydrogenase
VVDVPGGRPIVVSVDGATGSILSRARQVAEDVLWPSAADLDRADRVPAGQLDLLAAEGFYGLAAELAAPDLARVVETLASGCLTTAFVWLQHHGAVRAVAAAERPGLRERWLTPLREGRVRAGAAQAGVLPGPARVRARRVDGGYLLTGESPWVTGWGMIDVLHAAAREGGGADETVIWALLDAVAGPTLSVEPLDLVAVAASRTVLVRLSDHFVPDDRVTVTVPFAHWPGRDAAGLRGNGSLALGVVDRCARLIGPGWFERELDECRAALDAGTTEDLPHGRAAASALATRATAALAVATGSGAVLRGSHPERLAREALFLQVFGSRPAIRAALLAGYARDDRVGR